MQTFRIFGGENKVDYEEVVRAAITVLSSASELSLDNVIIRSIKVNLPSEYDADLVAQHIERLRPDLKAHAKGMENGQPVLALGFR